LQPLVAATINGSVELKLETAKHNFGSVFAALRRDGVAIEDVQTRDPDLEDIFVELTGRKAEAAA
jgi:ABC-2 type transport system ATP-binding protein